MDRLPTEVVLLILQRARDGGGLRSIANCMSSCRRIRNIASAILYEDVVISNGGLKSFLDHAHKPSLAYTRSMTVRIADSSDTAYDLSFQLRALATVLPQLRSLQSFSFFLEEEKPLPTTLPILRSDLAKLVDSLPACCTSLEIDTKCQDQAGPVVDHFCASLALAIPRLRHLRLRLSSLCDAMVKTLRAVSSLETVTLNCSYGRRQSRTCSVMGNRSVPLRLDTPMPDASQSRYTLTAGWGAALRRCQGTLKGNLSVSVVDWELGSQATERSPCDHSAFDVFRRRDVARNVTWALPSHDLWTNPSSSILIRTSSGLECIGSRKAVEALAEASPWHETYSGARLVEGVFLKPARPLFQADELEDKAAWKRRWGTRSCRLWVNEEATDEVILHAERREGLMDTDPVRWRVPEGWIDVEGVFE